MTNTNEEEIQTQKLGELYTNQLVEKIFDVIKNFREENFHLETSFLYQVEIHASKIILQTNISKLLAMIRKECQEKEYEEFMEDFKRNIFKAIQEVEFEVFKEESVKP